MTTARKETCRTCCFWAGVNESDLGECRRWTPVILTVDLRREDLEYRGSGDFAQQIESITRFPVTYAEDWCGEWEFPLETDPGDGENVVPLRPAA